MAVFGAGRQVIIYQGGVGLRQQFKNEIFCLTLKQKFLYSHLDYDATGTQCATANSQIENLRNSIGSRNSRSNNF